MVVCEINGASFHGLCSSMCVFPNLCILPTVRVVTIQPPFPLSPALLLSLSPQAKVSALAQQQLDKQKQIAAKLEQDVQQLRSEREKVDHKEMEDQMSAQASREVCGPRAMGHRRGG